MNGTDWIRVIKFIYTIPVNIIELIYSVGAKALLMVCSALFFKFREQATGEEFITNVRSSYLNFPLDVKYTALRLNNYRPYLIGGIYGSVDIGRKKGNPILLKSTDFGFEFGLGCDIYLPYFKLCPELKFCFGLVNLLEKDRPDLVDQANIKYTDALSKATSRMVILTFNFE